VPRDRGGTGSGRAGSGGEKGLASICNSIANDLLFRVSRSTVLTRIPTPGAACQDPDFLIGAGNKKQQNSDHLFRLLFHCSKSQAGNSHNVYMLQAISLIPCHKASEAPSPMFRSMGRRTKSMTKQASRTGFNVIIIIRNLSWNFSVMED
jgi:hypothetical protein